MKKLASILATFGITLFGLVAPSLPANAAACANAGVFAGGNGQAGTPFQIATPGQLQHLTVSMNSGAVTAGKFYEVTANLNFGGCDFTPSSGVYPFKGSFDGGNHTISNIAISNGAYSALFGGSQGAVIKNLKISNANIDGGSYSAAVVGLADHSSGTPTILDNITVSDSSITGDTYVGAVAGAAFNGSGDSLNRLKVTSTSVAGASGIGGLIGFASGYPSIDESGFFGGSIQRLSPGSTEFYFGGLVGLTDSNLSFNEVGFRGTMDVQSAQTNHVALVLGSGGSNTIAITDSYVRGEILVPNGESAAGMVGDNSVATNITRSYSQFSVTQANGQAAQASQFSAGGQTLTNSFYNSELHTNWNSVIAGAAKTDAEMLTSGTFGTAGWSLTGDAATVTNGTNTSTWYDSVTGGASLGGGYLLLTWEYLGLTLTPCQIGNTSYNGIAPCIAVPAGNFIQFTGQFEYQPCPVGFFQANVGSGGCVPAPAGSYVATEAATSAIPCAAGTYQASAGQTSCVDAAPGFFVANVGSDSQVACPAGTTSNAQATVCFAMSSSYDGPLVNPLTKAVNPGETVTITGERLETVQSVVIDGKNAIATCSATSCTFVVPNDVKPGTFDLGLKGAFGQLTVLAGVKVTSDSSSSQAAVVVWTKKLDDNSAKIYAKNLIGAGKVQFFLNGKEIAWVRAVDGTDPKLRKSNGSSYLVRTVEFADGKNVLEVYVDGVRARRAAYSN